MSLEQQTVDIRQINEKIEKESAFVDLVEVLLLTL